MLLATRCIRAEVAFFEMKEFNQQQHWKNKNTDSENWKNAEFQIQ